MADLAFEGVSHRYGSVHAIDSVDLAARAGETICLLGPSGCGKSTLLRLAAGLEELQAGRIEIGGRTVAAAGTSRRVPPESRGVGLVFQDYALFPHLTVLENVRYGLPGGRSVGEAHARRALAELGMSDLAERYPHALSGGQQQRVALLRAIVPRPRVMLLDEPFSTLDEHLRHEVRMETLNLLAGREAVTVLVTHDAEEAMLLADRIVVMRDGRLVQDASPDEIYTRPADLFTARLLGTLNVFEGAVRGGRVDTPLGPVPTPGVTASARVSVAVRADGLDLADAAVAPADRVRVRVRSVRRIGAWTLVLMTPAHDTREVRGPGERGREAGLHARLPGGAAVAAGDVLAVQPKPGQTFVFPAPEGAPAPAGARTGAC